MNLPWPDPMHYHNLTSCLDWCLVTYENPTDHLPYSTKNANEYLQFFLYHLNRIKCPASPILLLVWLTLTLSLILTLSACWISYVYSSTVIAPIGWRKWPIGTNSISKNCREKLDSHLGKECICSRRQGYYIVVNPIPNHTKPDEQALKIYKQTMCFLQVIKCRKFLWYCLF